MSIELLLFAIFASMALVSATLVVAVRDPVKGALSLVACFFSIACLYLLQAAELIAVMEVLVYAGAIMVLFVFVIMLVEQRDVPIVPAGLLRRVLLPVKLGAVALVTANVALVVAKSIFPPSQALPADFGSPAAIGAAFFSSFLFQFELTSVLLLVAIVGAMLISRGGPVEGAKR
jgi:NADH-quinone oxidoreductase subunit J